MSPNKLPAVIVAAMLVLTAFASVPVAAEEHELAVVTDEATNVTDTSATLNGNLTALGNASNVTVSFTYWEEGDSANATAVGNATLDAPGTFDASLSSLENDTTYEYVAHAETENDSVTGDVVTFTTGAQAAEEPSWDGDGPFGQWVTSWLKNLLPPDSGLSLGQLVSDLVTKNNPGSDHRSDEANPGGNGNGPPDHAGPPEDAGPSGEDADEDEDEDDEETSTED